MKKVVFSLRKSLVVAVLLVSVVGLFSACKKDSINNTNLPVAGLMAFNLSTDKSNVGIDLSGNPILNTPLGYPNYTGGYLNIYTGDRPVKSYNYYRDSVLATSNFTFDSSKYYSLFVVGANGVYKNIVAQDSFDSLSSTSGKAYVRYINAVPDSGMVSVTANGASLNANPASFGTVSEFVPVTAGDLNIAMKSTGEAAAQRTVTVQGGKAYTLLLIGSPSATDSTRTVQIRFIINAG